MDSIRYAVDTAYRTLRIPPLENTVVYNNSDALAAATIGTNSIYQSATGLTIPPDLVEFIHIRGRDANGLTTRVFNEKTDIRSFWDICNDNYNQTAFWSRQGNQVIITPAFGQAGRGFYGGGAGPEVAIEMYYYRRLPALNALFEVTAAAFDSQSEGGQIMNLVDTPADIPTFLAQDGNGRLYFQEHFEVTVQNFLDGDLTYVSDPRAPHDGALWFNPDTVNWAVTAANYAANDGRIFQVPNEFQSQGRLWFPALLVRDTFTGNPTIVTTTRPLLDPNNGNQDSGAISTVFRTRDGSTIALPEDTSPIDQDQAPDTWRFNRLHTNGTASITFGGSLPGDTYEIDYFSPPTEPTGTASDNQNAVGSLTSFFFRGRLNPDTLIPANLSLIHI